MIHTSSGDPSAMNRLQRSESRCRLNRVEDEAMIVRGEWEPTVG